MPILLVFVVLPILELWLLIETGARIGGLNTVALVALTAIIGTYLLRKQGLSTLMNAQARMQAGEIPAQEMFDGAMIVAAGALLLTPGFITDTIGFLLVVPETRRWIQNYLKRHAKVVGGAQFYGAGGFQSRNHGDEIIDGEIIDDEPANSATPLPRDKDQHHPS